MNMYKTIASRQNPLVKEVCALSQKKHRCGQEAFRFDGKKLFLEAIECRIPLKLIILRCDKEAEFSELCQRATDENLVSRDGIVTVTDEVFEKLSEEKSPEGVMCVAAFLPSLHKKLSAQEAALALGESERVLIAESLRDPGNLGTIMRSCAALGIDRLIMTDDCTDIYSQKTLRAAMGAIFRQKTLTVAANELPELISLLRERGRRIYATALHRDARLIGEIELEHTDAFVIGNEGHGLSEAVIDACDACAVIPMAENAESLNASAAAAICIWETVR